MNTDEIQKIRKKNLLILFFAILILMLNLFLPIVSIKTETAPEKDIYLNLDSMKQSYNEALNSLSRDITQVNLLLWIVIILGLFSFLGLLLKLSEKINILSNLFIISGCATLVFSSIICLFSFFVWMDINDFEGILPISIYVTLVLLVILVLITIYFAIDIVKAVLNEYKTNKIEKNKLPPKTKEVSNEESAKNPLKKKIKFKMDDWDDKKEVAPATQIQDNKEKQEQIKKTNIKEEKIEETVSEPEEKVEEQEKAPINEPFVKKEEKIEEKKEEVKKEEINEAEIISFEKALESAIKKKKTGTSEKQTQPLEKTEKKSISQSKEELKKEISKEIERNRKVALEKFNVKCPKCGSIFGAEKQPDGATKIKCPKCGKEGVIK